MSMKVFNLLVVVEDQNHACSAILLIGSDKYIIWYLVFIAFVHFFFLVYITNKSLIRFLYHLGCVQIICLY